MKEIWNDIKERFKKGDILTRLIYVNSGVFILSVLFSIILGLVTGKNYDSASSLFTWWFALPINNLEGFIFKPYTLITSMFLHIDLLHVFFNMLILYFLGKIFLNYFNQKQLFGLYVLGGLIGGIALLLITNISPYFKASTVAYGASAAVMAIVIGSVTPPVGILTYISCAIANTTISRVFWTIWPFCGIMIFVLFMAVLFPEIITLFYK